MRLLKKIIIQETEAGGSNSNPQNWGSSSSWAPPLATWPLLTLWILPETSRQNVLVFGLLAAFSPLLLQGISVAMMFLVQPLPNQRDAGLLRPAPHCPCLHLGQTGPGTTSHDCASDSQPLSGSFTQHHLWARPCAGYWGHDGARVRQSCFLRAV